MTYVYESNGAYQWPHTIKLNMSLTIGDTYRIEYNLSKDFANFGKRIVSGHFKPTVYVKFNPVYIALIVIACVCVLFSPVLVFLIVKHRKKVIYIK